ncbi:MAG: HEAT repeat domain-containing protein [Planctomycetes bacterium]|jgi:hypothetical protein|nr:HEAT repeat domain-containing protein [Planctomycetota bacterium]
MNKTWIAVPLALALAALPSCGSGSKDPEKTADDAGKKAGKKGSGEAGKKGGKKAEPAEPKAREPAPEVLAKLGSPDPDERSKAVREASACGKGATKALLGVLERGEPDARTAALLAIGRVGDPEARAPVEAFLGKAESAGERMGALEALGRVGGASSVPVLKRFLAFAAPVRYPPEADFMVEKARETEEGLVRDQAAESLARLGDFSGVPVLIENLLGNGWVRKDAIIRLRRMTACKLDFGYDIGASQGDRQAAVEKWKAWWAEKGASFKPEWTDSVAVFDLTKRG